MRELETEVASLKAAVAELTATVEDLRRQLGQNSKNSHRPPSTDPPGAVGPAPKGKKKRKRGGQPGHPGACRGLVGPDEVDELQEIAPKQCSGCGGRLRGTDLNPARHQVTELPPITPFVTEYRLHALRCDCCGQTTRASLPAGVPRGAFGPRLQAMIAMFSGAYRLSKRNVEQIAADCFGLQISLGSISNLESATSDALAEPVGEVLEYVKSAPAVHVDETSWRVDKRRAWLWVAATPLVAAFLVRASRGAVVARELLGDAFAGVLITDRWSAYNWLSKRSRQLCWAHLIRDFRQIAERGGAAKAIGESLLECSERLFDWWHRIRDGTLKRSSFRTYATALRHEVNDLLCKGAACPDKKTAGMCREMLKLESAMWTFARRPGVEPTNNTAERELRHAVIWRRTSFGTDSQTGSRFVERILTTVGTLRRQNRNVLEYLTAACQAKLLSKPAPSLLPVRTEGRALVA